jgi:hypothetical protein
MNKDFQNFIKHTDLQKEVSIAIAKDERELDYFKTTLSSNGFKEAHKVSEILEKISGKAKIYYSVEDEFPKSLYDLIVQYSTGQIEIFDFSSMKNHVVNPDYQKTSLVIVITKDNLSHFQKKGYPILANVGVAYQS